MVCRPWWWETDKNPRGWVWWPALNVGTNCCVTSHSVIQVFVRQLATYSTYNAKAITITTIFCLIWLCRKQHVQMPTALLVVQRGLRMTRIPLSLLVDKKKFSFLCLPTAWLCIQHRIQLASLSKISSCQELCTALNRNLSFRYNMHEDVDRYKCVDYFKFTILFIIWAIIWFTGLTKDGLRSFAGQGIAHWNFLKSANVRVPRPLFRDGWGPRGMCFWDSPVWGCWHQFSACSKMAKTWKLKHLGVAWLLVINSLTGTSAFVLEIEMRYLPKYC